MLCDPCIKWGALVALRIQNLLKATNTSGYNATIQAVLVNLTDYLTISCGREPDNTYCAVKLANYNKSYLLTAFGPCISNSNKGGAAGCAAQNNNDPCYPSLIKVYKDIGCCFAYFTRGLMIPETGASPYQQLFASITSSCGFGVGQAPNRCAQKKVTITFPLNNVPYKYIQAMLAIDTAWLNKLFGFNLGIDYRYVNVTCTADTPSNPISPTTCTIAFYPDYTAEAVLYQADFVWSILAQTVYLIELDYAPLNMNASAGGPRIDQSQPAYNAQSASVQLANDCMYFNPPVQYSLNQQTQTCTLVPGSAINILAHPFTFIASCALALLLL